MCRSKFYYYTLLMIGATSLLFFSRCNSGPSEEEKAARISDSLARVKACQDSIATADSIARAQREQARVDSIAKADSIARAKKPKKPKNPYKQSQPMTKYGTPKYNEPIAEYGVTSNTY